ncbi:MAG: CbrC family protein [Actinomadura sp.]
MEQTEEIRAPEGGVGGKGAARVFLPEFPYHPDPLATGSVIWSEVECVCCKRHRDHIYAGPVFAEETIERRRLCPWCIADGSAAARFGATFSDAGVDAPGDVPMAVIDTIARRTPGYLAWQQARWLFHCGDGAAFLGAVGTKELLDHPDAVEMLRGEQEGRPAQQIENHLAALDKDGPPTAYLFRCRSCGADLAYSDST